MLPSVLRCLLCFSLMTVDHRHRTIVVPYAVPTTTKARAWGQQLYYELLHCTKFWHARHLSVPKLYITHIFCICAILWRQMSSVSYFPPQNAAGERSWSTDSSWYKSPWQNASFTSAEIMQKCCVSKCLKISEEMAWHLKSSNCSKIVDL